MMGDDQLHLVLTDSKPDESDAAKTGYCQSPFSAVQAPGFWTHQRRRRRWAVCTLRPPNTPAHTHSHTRPHNTHTHQHLVYGSGVLSLAGSRSAASGRGGCRRLTRGRLFLPLAHRETSGGKKALPRIFFEPPITECACVCEKKWAAR